MSEEILIWGATALVAVVIVLGYAWRFRRRVRADAERKREAVALGIDKPAAQFPFIDPEHCIGCGACVAACPEGDVLGVVGGTAVVVNGLRCVGHARCEAACPVGAITVGLGDMAARADVPQVDPSTYETNIPGVYVVGELGGLALVKNAVAQGRDAAKAVAERVRGGRAGEGETLDLVIVGAGPSGVAAALVAADAGLRFVVFEREETLGGSLLHYPRRKMVLTQPVDLPPWGALQREEYQKEVLLETFETILADYGLPVGFGRPVTSISRAPDDPDELVVTTASPSGSQSCRTRHVILALGRRGSPRKLGVPGEELPKVMYRLIDAASYTDRDVLVVGGGDSAAEAAVGLSRQPGNRVTLSYRREKIVRVKKKNQDALDRAIADGSIRPLFASNLVAIEPDRVRLSVTNGSRNDEAKGDEPAEVELPNDDVFIFAGGVPPFGLLKDLGVRFGGEA